MIKCAFKQYVLLLSLQVFVAALMFSTFLNGQFYFAYTDIGSDSYRSYVPYAMHAARAWESGGLSGWAFEIGLGSPTALWMYDPSTLISQMTGEARVLPLRIWIYFLKIVLGGMAMLTLVRVYTLQWQTCVIVALAYSFCGFVVINGQWDSEATAFIFFPLLLWAISRRLKSNNYFALPLALALALVCGVFFISIAVFLVLTCMAFMALGQHPITVFKDWLLKILPLTICGYLLASPVLLPAMLQMMDSSRVSGTDGLFQKIWEQSFSLNDWALVLVQIGGLFHKDIFGIGSHYRGYWNYLEGPGFFIGITLLILIPQLWAGTKADRRICVLSIIAIALYFISPFFRYAAMGFAVPYFRVSTLWISLIVLLIAAKATDRVLEHGIDTRLLVRSFIGCLLLLAMVMTGSVGDNVWMPHFFKIVGLLLFSMLLLSSAQLAIIPKRVLPWALLFSVTIEILLIARPSYVNGRELVPTAMHLYNDRTTEALQTIHTLDRGVFRIEKTYSSASHADSLAQDYMGIKSYSLHSRGMVDFHIGTGLIPPSATVVNYSNWLPNAGPRYMLNSLLGVKYFIANEIVNWPGFVEVSNSSGLRIYRNDMALPFGVVQTRQITKEALAKVSTQDPVNAAVFIDAALLNAAVVDRVIPGHGSTLDLDALVRTRSLSLEDWYFSPAAELQRTGLKVEKFSSNHITGEISPNSSGILVFSIPFSDGWKLKVDGIETAMFRANFGMLGAPVGAGKHSVELVFEIPGQRWGRFLGALGLALLLLVGVYEYRRAGAR